MNAQLRAQHLHYVNKDSFLKLEMQNAKFAHKGIAAQKFLQHLLNVKTDIMRLKDKHFVQSALLELTVLQKLSIPLHVRLVDTQH